jgi:hypothetical protein
MIPEPVIIKATLATNKSTIVRVRRDPGPELVT